MSRAAAAAPFILVVGDILYACFSRLLAKKKNQYKNFANLPVNIKICAVFNSFASIFSRIRRSVSSFTLSELLDLHVISRSIRINILFIIYKVSYHTFSMKNLSCKPRSFFVTNLIIIYSDINALSFDRNE